MSETKARAALASVRLIDNTTLSVTERQAVLDALTAAGLAIVPVEPTEGMLNAAHDWDWGEGNIVGYTDLWAALLRAAQQEGSDGRS